MTTPTSSPLSPAAPAYPLSRRFSARLSDLFPAILAGLIAVLISYAGPLLLILQAAHSANLSAGQTASWIWAVSIGSGLCSVLLSWRTRLPVICAWNTPGAALLVSGLATVPYQQAIGAYIVAAGLLWLIGASGVFERLMAAIPKSLCAAMLAGILFRFGVEVFGYARSEIAGAPWLVAAMFVGYLLFKRRSARYAIVLTLLLGIGLWLLLGWGNVTGAPAAQLQFGLTRPLWTAPEFSLSAIVSLGLPLAVLCLTGQQVPGVAVLRAAGYDHTPTGKLVAGTGLASLLLAPFGAHGVNLAAITAAICTGPEAHRQPEKRWLAGVACGAFYLLLGSCAGALTSGLLHLPPALIGTVAGLALLGAIQNGLVNALAAPAEREAALVTFIVTASNISVLGLGAACWGIVLGGISYFVLRVPPRLS